MRNSSRRDRTAPTPGVFIRRVIFGASVFVVLAVAAMFLVPRLLVAYWDSGDAEGIETGVRVVLWSAGGVIAIVGVIVSLSRHRQELLDSQRADDSNVTERYTAAIGQLGADSLAIRLGGVYALERIAQDSERDHDVIYQVLAAFIRNDALQRGVFDDEPAQTPPRTRPEDVSAAITVLGRLSRNAKLPVNLSKTDLAVADLRGANLARVNLIGADLTKADLKGAHLTDARLTKAILVDAILVDANISETDFSKADLSGAHLTRSNLSGAHLSESVLSGADLDGANLTKAVLIRANLRGAGFAGAILVGAYIFGANLTKADLSGADLSGADLIGADLTRAVIVGADLSGADLSGVILVGTDLSGTDLSDASLDRARWDSDTVWPAGFEPPASA